MKRLILFPVAFAAGWFVGAVVMIGAASWRMLRDMDRPNRTAQTATCSGRRHHFAGLPT